MGKGFSMSNAVTYADVVTKQVVENWADERGFVADDQLALHMEERFRAHRVHVESANDQGDFLVLHLATDQWDDPREFALLADGALSW
jgi:hypothetical protein